MAAAGFGGGAPVTAGIDVRQARFEPVEFGFEGGQLIEHVTQGNGALKARPVGADRAHKAGWAPHALDGETMELRMSGVGSGPVIVPPRTTTEQTTASHAPD